MWENAEKTRTRITSNKDSFFAVNGLIILGRNYPQTCTQLNRKPRMLLLTIFLDCVTNIYLEYKKPVQSSQKEERTMSKVVSLALFLLNVRFC